jgi:hypothetical protein
MVFLISMQIYGLRRDFINTRTGSASSVPLTAGFVQVNPKDFWISEKASAQGPDNTCHTPHYLRPVVAGSLTFLLCCDVTVNA